MRQYLFPAIFVEEDDRYVALVPDLGIAIDGDNIEEAYIFAKNSLKVYCNYVENFDLEMPMPSKYEKILEKNPHTLVMLLDCVITPKKS